jgi:integrase
LGVAASGNDPSPRSDALSVVIKDYLAYATTRLRPGHFRHTQTYLQRHWRNLHHLPIASIKRRDVAKGLAEIASVAVAAGARSALSGLFSWAIREGYEIPANPVHGTNRPLVRSRDRVLSETELASIWRNANGEFGAIVKLLILTGQRRDEIGLLRWDEIDIERAVIVLLGNRTKNKREHIIPLSPLALSLLPERLGEYVFGGFSSYSRGKSQLDVASGVGDWRLHDLRRTCATMMADRVGVLPHIIEAILNHMSGHRAGVAGTYNRAKYLDPMRDALNRWATHITMLVG